MKKTAGILLLLHTCMGLFAQVPRRVVVEHFTNSNCTNCAAVNPVFFNNLKNYPGVLHLAVYPSAPYAACLFNQQSFPQNNARCNYYSIYGTTPRFVIQGEVKNNSNLGSASFFTPFVNQTTPVDLKLSQQLDGTDSIRIRAVITSVVTHTLSKLKLFVALAEDTVFYASPNGETKHFNVFRAAATSPIGDTISLGATAGDSLVINRAVARREIWNASRIYALGIVQIEDTAVVQAARSERLNTTVGIREKSQLAANIFSSGEKELTVDCEELPAQIKLFDLLGNEVFVYAVNRMQEKISHSLPEGIYYAVLKTEKGREFTKKILVN